MLFPVVKFNLEREREGGREGEGEMYMYISCIRIKSIQVHKVPGRHWQLFEDRKPLPPNAYTYIRAYTCIYVYMCLLFYTYISVYRYTKYQPLVGRSFSNDW